MTTTTRRRTRRTTTCWGRAAATGSRAASVDLAALEAAARLDDAILEEYRRVVYGTVDAIERSAASLFDEATVVSSPVVPDTTGDFADLALWFYRLSGCLGWLAPFLDRRSSLNKYNHPATLKACLNHFVQRCVPVDMAGTLDDMVAQLDPTIVHLRDCHLTEAAGYMFCAKPKALPGVALDSPGLPIALGRVHEEFLAGYTRRAAFPDVPAHAYLLADAELRREPCGAIWLTEQHVASTHVGAAKRILFGPQALVNSMLAYSCFWRHFRELGPADVPAASNDDEGYVRRLRAHLDAEPPEATWDLFVCTHGAARDRTSAHDSLGVDTCVAVVDTPGLLMLVDCTWNPAKASRDLLQACDALTIATASR